MARYTEKTEADLAWERIRREVQYRINFAAATWRAEKANEILPVVQERFEQAMLGGTLLELESSTVAWVDDVLNFEEPVA